MKARDHNNRYTEEQFRLQADALPQMVWATDADGNHLYYNRRWYEYTGQTIEESLGFGFVLALHPDDEERTLERWRRAWAGGENYEIEYRFRRHDGVYRWFVGRAEPVRDPVTGLVTMWAGTCTDIDDLKRTQEALRVSEERLRDAQARLEAALLAGEIATWEWDLVNDRVVADANLARLFGVSASDAAGGKLDAYLAAVHPEDRARVTEIIRNAIAHRDNYASEYRVILSDGSHRWLAARGKVKRNEAGRAVSLPGVVVDITERVERERKEQFLADLTSRMRALLDPEEVLYETAKAVGQYMGTHRCLYIEIDDEAGTLTVLRDYVDEAAGVASIAGTYPQSAFGPPIIESLRAGNITQSDDTEIDPRLSPEHRTTFRATEFRAFLGIPLHRGGRWVAILAVHYALPRSWTREEAELLMEVAERTWLAVENARLYRTMQEFSAKNERIAETLQRSMLVAPPLNRFAGMEIATDYQSAWDEAQIGGDFQDTFALSGSKVALIVGDATGKGLKAAAHTAEVKYALRAFLRENSDAADALTRLNRFLVDGRRLDGNAEETSYVAIALAILDVQTGKGACACAGAEPPLVIRASKNADAHDAFAVEEVTAIGPLAGADEDSGYDAVEFSVTENDVLVMTTDGITEARSPTDRRRFFGAEGVAEVVQAGLRGSLMLGDLAKSITVQAKEFAGGKLHDDVCLLLVRRKTNLGGK